MALTRRKINSLYEEKETSAAKQEKLDRFRAGYLKDTSAALPETKNPPVKISAGGFTEQAGGDIRADLMQAADATRNAKSGNAASAALQGIGMYSKELPEKQEENKFLQNVGYIAEHIPEGIRAGVENIGTGLKSIVGAAGTAVDRAVGQKEAVGLKLPTLKTGTKPTARTYSDTQKYGVEDYSSPVKAVTTSAATELMKNAEKYSKADEQEARLSAIKGKYSDADIGAVTQLLADITYSAGYTLPADVAGLLAGPAGTAVVMGTAAFGDALAEGMEKGYTRDNALQYALKETLNQAAMETLFDIAGGGIAEGKIMSAIDGIPNAIGRAAAKIGATGVGEGVEEVAQSIISTVNQKTSGDKEAEVDLSELGYEFLVGSLAGALRGAPVQAAQTIMESRSKPTKSTSAQENTPIAVDNTTTETADVQTAKTEQNAPISEDVAKTSEDVAKTEETAAISDEESIVEEDIETFDETVDEDSPVAKSLRIAETDVYTAGNELVNAYGGDVRKAVDALYAEGNRLVKDGSAEARAKLSTVEAVRSDILSNNAKRVERNAEHLRKTLTQYGIKNVTVDMSLADKGVNGYYVPGSKTIAVSPKLSGQDAVNFVVAHELGHHAAAADSTLVNDIAGIESALVERGLIPEGRYAPARYMEAYAAEAQRHAASASGQAELKAHMDSGMTKEQAVQRIVDDYIHQEMASDILGELAKNPDILKRLKREDRTLWQRIVDAVQDFLAKVSGTVETREQQKMLDTIRSVISDASGVDITSAHTLKNKAGVDVAYDNGDGNVRMSLLTYEDGGRDALLQYLDTRTEEGGISEADKKSIIDSMDEIYTFCRSVKNEYEPFGAWSDALVEVDENGDPVFSVVKANGEYAMNLDFSLVCKKRRTLDAVFNEMIHRGVISDFDLGQDQIVRINDVIREHGFETACTFCFVDSKRFRRAKVADDFVNMYNGLVKSLAGGKPVAHFNYGGDETISSVENGIDTISDDALDFTRLEKVLSGGKSKTVPYKIAEHLMSHPEDRKLLSRGDFMSSYGFEQVKKQNPAVLSLYNSKKGSGGPKASFGDVQYLSDVLSDGKFKVNEAFDVGGVRVQSFSDYVARLVFDYVQMIGDLAAKELPAHAYTKEALFAKQFGLTGMKINMSLAPAVGDGQYAGLNADGSYAFAAESFDFETAKAIQNDLEYGKNCGTIAIGVSDQHIRKLLSDPDIRMVIPYHKSGLNPVVAKMNNISAFSDYTKVQNTRYKNGTKLSKTDLEDQPNFNRLMQDGMTAVEAANAYLDWCREHDYLPKFDKFASDPNYYKMLEDFTTMVDGQFHPQGAVKAVFPSEGSAFGSMQELIRSGLEEDAVEQGRRDSEVSGIVDEIVDMLGDENSDIRLSKDVGGSRWEESETFNAELASWEKEGRNSETVLEVGMTGDVLQGLGALENDIYILGDKINKILEKHPEITLDEIRKIPQILNNPVLILKSSGKKTAGQNTRLVIFGSVKAKNGQPVLSVLDLRPVEDKLVIDDMQKVTSVYTKDNNPVEFIRSSDVLYAEKKISTRLLRTIGFQMPIELHDSGYVGSISYDDQNVNIEGKKFSEVFAENSGDVRYSIDMSSLDEDSRKIVSNLKTKSMAARYLTGEYASMTPERFKSVYNDSAAKGSPDYASQYIAWVKPADFLYATTTDTESRERIRSEAGELDVEKLRGNGDAMWLTVDKETGEIVGHEGRHRMAALDKAGVKEAAVLIRFVNADKKGAKPIGNMKLEGQTFTESDGGYTPRGTGFYLHDALPLSERFGNIASQLFCTPEREGNIRYSKELDADYMAAVESDDMETAQRMVDDAAKAAGYTYRRNARNVLSPMNSVNTHYMFVESDGSELSVYGENKYVANKENAIDLNEDASEIERLAEEFYGEQIAREEITPPDIVMSAGVWDDLDFVEYVWDNYLEEIYYETDSIPAVIAGNGLIVFGDDFGRIKTLDPVVYDDNGDVIPLSERFKDDNSDIRFSKETRLTEENEYLKRQFVKRQGNEWAKAVEPKARRKYAAKLAGELKGVSASAIDAQLAKVWKVFEQPIRGGLDTMEVRYDEALKAAHEAAAELISGAKAANLNPLYEQYADLRKRLKDTAINPGSAKTDIPDYSDWRKESMGVLRLSDKGASVEGIWDELCGQYPEFFDASITDEAERIRVLADVANKLRAVPGNPMYVMDGVSPEDADAAIGEMETSLAHSILSGYDLIAEETYAAKAEKERVRGENASAKAYAQSMRDAENAQSNLENERIRTENAAKQAQAEAEGAILRYTNEAKGVLAKANDAVIKAQNFEKKVWADFTREYNALQVSWRKANRAVETAQQKVILEKRKAEDARRRQELAAVRKNFMGNLTRIYNMTVDPTKNKHVPDEMREAVASLLEQFAGTRLPSGKTVDYNILVGIGEDAYANAEKESLGRMERIFGVIQQKNHSSDGGVTQNFIRDMENQIEMLRDMYSEINMRSADGTVMRPDAATTKNIEYLRQCNRILSMLDKYIRDMNVNFLAGKAVNAHEMAQSVVENLSKRKQESTDKFLSDVQYDFMTPETFLDRLGPIGREITKAYRRAQNRQAAFEQSFTDYMKTLTGGKYSTYDVGFNGKLVELAGNDGKILKVPKDQIMELYVLWNRPAARRHIRNGGVYFLDEHGKEIDTRRMVFDSGIEKVFDALTEEDKRICDGIVRFLSTRCADWGNEASLYLYGYRKFGDTKYFPMNVSKSHLPGNWDQMDDFARLENLGFTKKLGDNASAPLRLGGIFNTADSHVRAMAAYSAYAPINNDVTRMVDMAGMKGNIEKYLGKRGYSYLTDFIKAVEQNKVRSRDNIAIAKGFDKLGNAYKRAAVSWNISTAAKQPISMVRALNAIDGKYIAKAYADLMKHKDAVDAVGRMVDASGVAKMKVLGYSDVGFGKSLRQNYDDSYSPMGDRQKNMVLRNLAKAYEGFTDAGMWMAGKMDEATWARIWRACELETADKYKGLTFAEQTQKTAERFNEVIGQTQVVDTILDNAPILRSEKASLYTAFMSEPVKSLNSLIAAHDAMVEKRPGAKKQLGKAVGTFVVSNILLEPLVSIVFSMFRDDEDETDFETVTEKALNLWVGVPAGKDGDKWLASEDGKKRVDELISDGISRTKAEAKAKREYIWGDFGVDFISSQVFSALTGAIPYVNGLVDAVTNTILGYDNDRIDMANISKAVRSTMNLAKAYNGAGEQQKSLLNLWVTMLEDSAAIAGIPAKTFRRDLTAIYRTVLQATDSYNMQWELNKMLYNINSSTARTQKGFFDIMARAAKAGDTEAYKRMSNDLEEIIGSGSVGIKRSTITSQLEKRGYEPEIGSDIWYIDLQAGFDLDTFNTGMQAERMITDLYRETKEISLIPKSPSDSFTVSGETVKISDPLKYQAFAEEVGDFSYMILVNMASSDGYKNLTDAQKQYAIEKAYDYARRRSRKRLYSAYDMGENLFKELYEKNAAPSSVASGIIGKAKEKK